MSFWDFIKWVLDLLLVDIKGKHRREGAKKCSKAALIGSILSKRIKKNIYKKSSLHIHQEIISSLMVNARLNILRL